MEWIATYLIAGMMVIGVLVYFDAVDLNPLEIHSPDLSDYAIAIVVWPIVVVWVALKGLAYITRWLTGGG